MGPIIVVGTGELLLSLLFLFAVGFSCCDNNV